LVYLASGFIFFFYYFGISKIKINVTKRDLKSTQASEFLTLYVLFVPAFTHFLVLVLRYTERGVEGTWGDSKYFVISTIILLLLLVASVFIFVHWVEGLVTVISFAFLVYSAV
jgi:hypothetical protein